MKPATMEINLILTAKSWQLASQLERTKAFGGVLIVKNVPERTYLAVTPKQWQVLSRFNESRTVPQVLESVINDRLCIKDEFEKGSCHQDRGQMCGQVVVKEKLATHDIEGKIMCSPGNEEKAG